MRRLTWFVTAVAAAVFFAAGIMFGLASTTYQLVNAGLAMVIAGYVVWLMAYVRGDL